MSGTTSGSGVPGRRSLANMGAFVFGLPLGMGILLFIFQLPEGTALRRYVEHPVEWVEVIMFCFAFGALIGKVLGQLNEKRVFAYELLPPWEGQPVPVTEAGSLLDGFRELGRGLRNTYLVQRVTALLEFVRSRGSANDLDDQMRTLADTDAIALESSYSFLKLVIWAIPILGFLGTQQPTPTYTYIAQGCTLLYFAFFFLMPWWSRAGGFRPVPDRVRFAAH